MSAEKNTTPADGEQGVVPPDKGLKKYAASGALKGMADERRNRNARQTPYLLAVGRKE